MAVVVYRVKKDLCVNDVTVLKKDEYVSVKDLDKVNDKLRSVIGFAYCNVNVSNTNYFEQVRGKEFKEGDYVLYPAYSIKQELFKVLGYDNNTYTYEIVNTGGNKRLSVGSEKLEKANIYYFVNSCGQICLTNEEKCHARDEWTKISGNHFDTYEEARKHMLSIRDKK